jgi:hypothetical protein
MVDRSTAWFVPYDLRPAKQIERRIVLETIQAARGAGVDVGALSFVGMGGVRYVDFLLAHKLIGSKKFTSIEHDTDLVKRCEFNKPFDTVEVFSGKASDYIDTRGFDQPSIVWLDFESTVSPNLIEDTKLLGGAIRPGSFVFVTASAELPARVKAQGDKKKQLADLRNLAAPFVDDITDAGIDEFPPIAAGIVSAALKFGFAGRGDGELFQYLRLNYKDTNWMLTVGGYFGPPKTVRPLREIIRTQFQFLRSHRRSFVFAVEQFNITDAERRLFDRAAISRVRRRLERSTLRNLNFRPTIIEQYPIMMRFIPRYFESLL